MEEKQGLTDLKKEIGSLKTQLSEVNQVKESKWKKSKELNQEVGVLVKELREVKRQLDGAKGKTDDLVKKRDAANQEARSLVQQLRQAREERRGMLSKAGVKRSPEGIKKKIAALEMTVETSGMPFDKEKKVTAQIKQLKRVLKENEVVAGVSEKIDALVKLFEEKKVLGNTFHEQWKEEVKKKRDNIKRFKQLVQQINRLRGENKEVFGEFVALKKSFVEANQQLKSKLGEAAQRIKQEGFVREQRYAEKKAREEQLIRQKELAVEQKLREKKKLTTQDLLVFQKS